MWFSSFTPNERTRLLGRTATPVTTSGSAGSATSAAGFDSSLPPLTRMLRHDQGAWLSDNLLERGDAMSMAASLELRPPFLDIDLVRFARTIPPSILLHRREPKWVLKQVAAPLLPAEIIHRPKSGFRVPLDAWFRGSLRSAARDALLSTDSLAARSFDIGIVRGILDRHDRGLSDESQRVWTLLSLEMWASAVGLRPPV